MYLPSPHVDLQYIYHLLIYNCYVSILATLRILTSQQHWNGSTWICIQTDCIQVACTFRTIASIQINHGDIWCLVCCQTPLGHSSVPKDFQMVCVFPLQPPNLCTQKLNTSNWHNRTQHTRDEKWCRKRRTIIPFQAWSSIIWSLTSPRSPFLYTSGEEEMRYVTIKLFANASFHNHYFFRVLRKYWQPQQKHQMKRKEE